MRWMLMGVVMGVCVGGALAGCAQPIASEKAGGGDVRAASLAAARREKSDALVAEARRLWEATRFEEAKDLLRQAVIMDPQNEDAALLLRIVTDKVMARSYEATHHRAGIEVARGNVDAAEHLVPYADLVIYPENWVEVTRRR